MWLFTWLGWQWQCLWGQKIDRPTVRCTAPDGKEGGREGRGGWKREGGGDERGGGEGG